MRKILAFDSCNGICSVALQFGEQIVGFIQENQVSMQSARLFPMIEEVLAKNNSSYSDLTHIAVNIGPGSFTGVRVGVAAAHGLKLVTKLPIIGVSGLLSLACLVNSPNRSILAIMDARRSQYFVQKFDSKYNPISEACLVENEQLADLTEDNPHIVTSSDIVPHQQTAQIDAKMVLTAANFMLNKDENYDYCQPLYIRESDAKLPT